MPKSRAGRKAIIRVPVRIGVAKAGLKNPLKLWTGSCYATALHFRVDAQLDAGVGQSLAHPATQSGRMRREPARKDVDCIVGASWDIDAAGTDVPLTVIAFRGW